MRLLLFVFAALVGCGCRNARTNADLDPWFLSETPRLEERPSAARLTTEQAIQIARDVAIAHHAQLEDYRVPQANFNPEYRHWWVHFLSKRPPPPDRGRVYDKISVSIDDVTGEAAYNSRTPALKRAIDAKWERDRVAQGIPNFADMPRPDAAEYRKAALKSLISEANQVAKALKLQEDLPITETNGVRAFILPFIGAQAWKAIGTIDTRNYNYCVSIENKFCFLDKLRQEEDRDRWHREYVWPASRMDKTAAYQLATQWLSAVSMDVRGLNEDCRLHIRASTPEGSGIGRRFVPLYTVYWVKGPEGQGSTASVQLFLPTKTLLQLRVEDPQYILRPSLVITNLAALLSRTNAP